MKKNVAGQSIGSEMITAADGTAFTGTVTVLITIDNGTQSASGGTAPAHEGNGYHSYTPTQAETNGDHLAFTFTGTGAIPSTIQTYTNFPQTVDNATGIADIPTTAEFEARTLVAADYFDPATDAVANVTLVDTTTTNTDMRGTDSALLAASAPSNWSALGITVGGAISDVVLCATTTTNTDMRGTDSALLASSAPTNWSALGISVGGAIDNVTLCATTTTNTDMRGTDSAATASNLAIAQNDLDIITGADGAILLSGTQASIDAIEVDTSTTIPAQISALNDISVSDILTTQMTEAYAADNVAPTLAQALFLIQQTIGDFSIAGTTITAKRIDGASTAATYTLDDGTNPTSRTRAT